jgi:hypothetical protein
VPKAVSSTDGSRGNQDQIGPRSGTSADDEPKFDVMKGLEKVVEEQNEVLGEETEYKAKAVASSQQQPNWTVRFGKPNHLISPRSR